MDVLANWVGLMMVNDVHNGRGYNARAGITDRCVWNPEVRVYFFFSSSFSLAFAVYLQRLFRCQQILNLRYI